jgi:hypothetical protein
MITRHILFAKVALISPASGSLTVGLVRHFIKTVVSTVTVLQVEKPTKDCQLLRVSKIRPAVISPQHHLELRLSSRLATSQKFW